MKTMSGGKVMRLILASKSPRRSEILKNIGAVFDVCESNFNESYDSSMSPHDIVRHLSYCKAKSVSDCITDDALIIGADTIVVCDNIIMGKPVKSEDSFNMLRILSGRWHKVYTGLCVIEKPSGLNACDVEVTDVKIKQLSDKEIWDYINTGEPEDKAGSYAIQGLGCLIVEKINGCYYNIVGLPIFKLSTILSKFGVDFFNLRSLR